MPRLITWLGWRAISLVNLPLGLVAIVLAYRVLPADRPRAGACRGRFDVTGMLLLAVTLAAYAMATTAGRGGFGAVNIALLLAAAVGAGLFIRAESRATSPLVRLAMFRNPVLCTGFALSGIVTTVVMATLIVGPFYLSGALGLDAAGIGLVMSSGPIVAALAGVPAGRFVDRLGASRMSIGGLLAMLIGAALLSIAAPDLGVAGYVAPLAVITAGYAIFQAANKTAVMAEIRADERGAVSGMLTLSRNLGLVTGASVMGAIFAAAAGAGDMAVAGRSRRSRACRLRLRSQRSWSSWASPLQCGAAPWRSPPRALQRRDRAPDPNRCDLSCQWRRASRPRRRAARPATGTDGAPLGHRRARREPVSALPPTRRQVAHTAIIAPKRPLTTGRGLHCPSGLVEPTAGVLSSLLGPHPSPGAPTLNPRAER